MLEGGAVINKHKNRWVFSQLYSEYTQGGQIFSKGTQKYNFKAKGPNSIKTLCQNVLRSICLTLGKLEDLASSRHMQSTPSSSCFLAIFLYKSSASLPRAWYDWLRIGGWWEHLPFLLCISSDTTILVLELKTFLKYCVLESSEREGCWAQVCILCQTAIYIFPLCEFSLLFHF